MPARRASSRRAAVSAASSSSPRRGSPPSSPGCRRRHRGAPAIRAANSSPRSPAKTRCVWLSTKPGITQRPPASISSSASAPARSTATTSPSSITTAASRTSPSGPSPSAGSLVTSSPMLSTTRRSCGQTPATIGSAAGTSNVVCRPSRTTHSPPTITSRTSAAVAANTRLTRVPRPRCPPAHGVEPERREVGERARREAAASGQPERGVAAGRGGVEQAAPRGGRRGRRSRAARRAPPRAPPRTGRSPHGSRSRRRAPRRVREPSRRADAVGEVALGGRAEAAPSRRAAEQRDVVVGQVRRVDRGEARAERAGVGEQRGRRDARGRRGSPRSPSAARRRGRAAAAAGGPRRRRPAPPGSTARTLWIAAPTRAGRARERVDALDPGTASRSVKRRWTPSARCRRAGSRRRAA